VPPVTFLAAKFLNVLAAKKIGEVAYPAGFMHESIDSGLAAANPTKSHLGGSHGRVDGSENSSYGQHSSDDVGC